VPGIVLASSSTHGPASNICTDDVGVCTKPTATGRPRNPTARQSVRSADETRADFGSAPATSQNGTPK
jgi:hypothetical protein